MRKSILSYISDIIYLSFVSGLAALILSRYYLGQGFASLIIAVCAAIATDCGYLAYKTKRQNKILFKKADEEKYTAFVTSLSVEREEDAANILFEELKKGGLTVTATENSVKIDGILTLCKITPEPIGANEAARLY
ncbi:MAG: hypothetical protein IJS67_00240, partial [Clostridia bacterium]|nr:hypothetical protein [Clostridia bacterium]